LDLEARWRQRSSANWLRLGDNNIKFFHTVANACHNKNMAVKIKKEDETWCDKPELKVSFF
jgi:hypothetical protein